MIYLFDAPLSFELTFTVTVRLRYGYGTVRYGYDTVCFATVRYA